MSAAYFADPDAWGVVTGYGLGVPLPAVQPVRVTGLAFPPAPTGPTLTDRVLEQLALMPAGLTLASLCDRLGADPGTVGSLAYRLCLRGRLSRERTSTRHPWRYRVAA